MSSLLNFITETLNNDPTKETIFNWREIAKIPLPLGFIRQYHKILAWDVMCQHQPFDLATINEFERYINYDILAKNANISNEVLLNKLDKMDWESLQSHQKFNADMINKFKSTIDPAIVLKYQKLDEESIMNLLENYIQTEKWVLLRGLLDIVFANQVVSESFILRFIKISPRSLYIKWPENSLDDIHSDDEEVGTEVKKEIMTPLVNMALIMQYQKLSVKFIQEYVYNGIHHDIFCKECFKIACQYQKLDDTFICTQMMDVEPFVSLLLTFQKLSEDTIMSMFVPLIQKYDSLLRAFVVSQQFSKIFLENLLGTIKVLKSEEDFKILNDQLNTTLFLRGICGNLSWNMVDIDNLSTQIDWVAISSQHVTDDQLNALISKYPSKLPWYILIKNHFLSENVLLDAYANNYIGAIEWWLALTTYKYSESFAKTHEDKKFWWKHISETKRMQFYEDCLNVVTLGDEFDNIPDLENEKTSRKNLRTFLNDFVEKADWAHILRYEPLDEWFIRIFSHFEKKIDMFYWKVARYQKLSEPFIRKYIDKFDLSIVIGYQTLSQEYIEELIQIGRAHV